MNRIFVFLGLMALFILVANVEMFALVQMFEGSAFLWAAGAFLFYALVIKKGACRSKCSSAT